MSETSSDPGPWQVGEIYRVYTGSENITGKLVSVSDLELAFDTNVGSLAVEFESCSKDDGFMIVRRSCIVFAARQVKPG